MLLNLKAIKYNIFKALFNHSPDKAGIFDFVFGELKRNSYLQITSTLFFANL